MADDQPTRRARWIRRRSTRCVAGIAIALVVAAVAVAGRPALHLARAAWSDRRDDLTTPTGSIDDFSRLERQTATVVPVAGDPAEAERQIAGLLALARERHLRVAIAGARHSQGGHVVAADGVVLDLRPFAGVAVDAERSVARIRAGTLWSAVIAELDRHGLAVEVMQSDADFSVGGSLSVDCHGWQPGRPPIAATVVSLRVMLADGTVVRCSRDERRELFGLVLGGYGLVGVILEAELRVVPNRLYRIDRAVLTVAGFADAWAAQVDAVPAVGLAYGRICVAEDGFLDHAILTTATAIDPPGGAVPPLGPAEGGALRRAVFRGSVGSAYGKSLRWRAERDWLAWTGPREATRNQLMTGTVDEYVVRAADRVDILEEYFVPRARLADFVSAYRKLVPRDGCDLLNATVREVRRDDDAFLRYADQDQFAVVLFYEIDRTPVADARLGELTRATVDAALAVGGRYYLPYRPHPTRTQFRQAYPRADDFFAAKRRLDPEGLFQSEFSRRYGPDGP